MPKKMIKLTKLQKRCISIVEQTQVLGEKNVKVSDILDYALQFLAAEAMKAKGHPQLSLEEALTTFTHRELLFDLYEEDLLDVPNHKLLDQRTKPEESNHFVKGIEHVKLIYKENKLVHDVPSKDGAIEQCTNCQTSYTGLYCPNCDQ